MRERSEKKSKTKIGNEVRDKEQKLNKRKEENLEKMLNFRRKFVKMEEKKREKEEMKTGVK